MLETSNDQTQNGEETAPLVAQVLALLGKVTEQFQSEEHENWQWLAQHSSNPLIVEILRDSTLTGLRVLNAIGRLEPVNGITISAQFRIPKGTVSKVTRRLIAQNLISTEFLPKNKKEILFRLTPLGRELFEVHRAFDAQMERGFVRFLQRYPPDELRLLARVLQDATEASFLTLGLQAPAAQEQAEAHAEEQTTDHV
jgi:DNA-binding MarR family transcriptional regulator